LSVEERRVHIESGTPANVLSSLSDQIKADVIVIGRHRPRTDLPADLPVGSTAYSIITRTLSPCLVTSKTLSLPIRRALVAIDASEAARGALLVALSWSSALRNAKSKEPDPTLTALHVESGATLSAADAHMKRTIDHELDVLRRSAGSWAGVSVEGATETNGDPVKAITKYATDHEAELVVLGTRGVSAVLALRLGSVSAAVTRRLRLPVLLVPPSVWRDFARDIDYF
jgi:nucleotide-binding universal stress UspA family protein